jgi:hypothetical protein
MYNYYVNEKKIKQEREKEANEYKQQKLKHKRKKELEKLVEGYEGRLKNFLYNMASEPIVISDYNNNINSSRKLYLDESAAKIIGHKGFVHKGYKTEKQRVEDYLKEKNFGMFSDDKMLQFMRDSKSYVWDNSKRVYINNGPEHTILQPSMRFRHRSELERIADINNSYRYGRVDMKVIEKHLKSLGLNVSQKVENSQHVNNLNNSYSDDDDYMPFLSVNSAIEKQRTLEQEKQKQIREKIIKERNEMKDRLKKKYQVNEAKNIMSDLHSKTHFKGSSNFALFNTSSGFFKHKKTESAIDLPSPQKLVSDSPHKYKSLSNSASKTSLTFSKQLPPKAIVSADIKNELIQMNPLLFKLGSDIYNIAKDDEQFDPEKFKRCEDLAFNREYNGKSKRKNMGFLNNIKSRLRDSSTGDRMFRQGSLLSILSDCDGTPDKVVNENFSVFVLDKKKEEKIRIDGRDYKKDDLENIAKKVLRKCNFFHGKSQNNQAVLKSQSGKLMQTNGLSISDFSKKYKIIPNSKNT